MIQRIASLILLKGKLGHATALPKISPSLPITTKIKVQSLSMIWPLTTSLQQVSISLLFLTVIPMLGPKDAVVLHPDHLGSPCWFSELIPHLQEPYPFMADPCNLF